MGKGNNNARSPKSQISIMATASVLLGILGISLAVLRLEFYRPWWSEFVARNTTAFLGVVGLILGFMVLRRVSKRIAATTLLVLLCFFLLQLSPFVVIRFFTGGRLSSFIQMCILFLSVACLVGLLAIPYSRGWRSSSKANFRGALGTALGALLVALWWIETCGPTSLALRMSCGANLTRLGKTMLIYANDNEGHYPQPDQWCDLLLREGRVENDCLLCPGIKWEWRRQVLPWPIPRNERCYYAMNPHCEPKAPPDTVLLFETEGGWNVSGGLGLLTAENHRGDGCNVLFNDGHVEFVRRKQIADLKWGVEEKDGESISQQGDST